MLVASLGNTRFFLILPAAAPAPRLAYLKQRDIARKTPLARERRMRRRMTARKRMNIALENEIKVAGASLKTNHVNTKRQVLEMEAQNAMCFEEIE
jgi:hypothetical protein